MIDRACISLSNACNLKCKYCHFQDKQKEISWFVYADLITILNNIHEYCLKKAISVFKVGIVGAGEPLLQKNDLFRILAFIKQNSYSELNLYTISNGTLLSHEDVKRFYAYKDVIKLCISLDGYKELHDLGRSQFDKVMQVIEIYRQVFGVMPHINTTVNKVSYENKEKLVDFFLTNGFLNVTFSKLVGYTKKDLFLSEFDFQQFIEYAKSRGMVARQFRKEKKYDCTMYGTLCGVGRTNIFYTPEGVYPCGRFYKNEKYKMGEGTDSLFEIEQKMKMLKTVKSGECYYKKFVEKNV